VLFCVACVLGVLFFLKRWKKYFEILFGLEGWKLFCNFCSVRWLVRIANVLTPVRWLFLSRPEKS